MNIIYSFLKDATFLAAPSTPLAAEHGASESVTDALFFVLHARSVDGNERFQRQLTSSLANLATLHQDLLRFTHSLCDTTKFLQSTSAVDLEADKERTAPLPPTALHSCAMATLPLFRVVAASHSDTHAPAASGGTRQYYFLYEYLHKNHFSWPPDVSRSSEHFFTTWDTYLVACATATFGGSAAAGPCCTRLSLKQYMDRSMGNTGHSGSSRGLSVAVWDEETLWRLLNALISVLAVYHSAGFHFGGDIKWEDIVCFAIPSKLAGQMRDTQRFSVEGHGTGESPHPHWDPQSSRGVVDAESFVKALTSSVVMPQLFIDSHTPSHRSFFVLTSPPSSAFHPPEEEFPEAVASHQAADVRCVGRIVLAVAETFERVSESASAISSEFLFLVRRMCGRSSESPAIGSDGAPSSSTPSALHLTQLQALRLRATTWFYRLLAEEYLHCAQGAIQVSARPHTATQAHLLGYTDASHERENLEVRERALAVREQKLDAMLELYELAHERLDALPSPDSPGYAQLRQKLATAKLDIGATAATYLHTQPSAVPRGESAWTPPHGASSQRVLPSSTSAVAPTPERVDRSLPSAGHFAPTTADEDHMPYTSPLSRAVKEQSALAAPGLVAATGSVFPSPVLTPTHLFQWISPTGAAMGGTPKDGNSSTPMQHRPGRERSAAAAATPPSRQQRSPSPPHTPIAQTPHGGMHTPTRPPLEPLGKGDTGSHSKYRSLLSAARSSPPAGEKSSAPRSGRSPRARGSDDGWAQSQFVALEELRAKFDTATAAATTGTCRASRSRSGSRAVTPCKDDKAESVLDGPPPLQPYSEHHSAWTERSPGHAAPERPSPRSAKKEKHDSGTSPAPSESSAYVPFFSSLSGRQMPRSARTAAQPQQQSRSQVPATARNQSTSTGTAALVTSARTPLNPHRSSLASREAGRPRAGTTASNTLSRSPFGLRYASAAGGGTAATSLKPRGTAIATTTATATVASPSPPWATADAALRSGKSERRSGDGPSASTALDLLKRLRNSAALNP